MEIGDIFSGIGCVAQALLTLGIDFKYKFACDIDRHCAKNLAHNFDIENFYYDVTEITSLPHVELFTAGFPCQPFSTNNAKTRGKNHPKYDMFTHTIKCLKLCDPDTFILENVAGLTYRNNREYFNYIKKTLDNLEKYKWEYRVLNSKDYGTPQSRNRVFFIGSKKRDIKFPEKSSLAFSLMDVLDLSLPMEQYTTSSKNQKYLELTNGNYYIDNGNSSGNFCKYRRLPVDTISCLTSRCHCLFTKRENIVYRRKLTGNEHRVFQNIHPSFENVCSEAQFVKQIGNGMDVGLMSQLIKLNCE